MIIYQTRCLAAISKKSLDIRIEICFNTLNFSLGAEQKTQVKIFSCMYVFLFFRIFTYLFQLRGDWKT